MSDDGAAIDPRDSQDDELDVTPGERILVAIGGLDETERDYVLDALEEAYGLEMVDPGADVVDGSDQLHAPGGEPQELVESLFEVLSDASSVSSGDVAKAEALLEDAEDYIAQIARNVSEFRRTASEVSASIRTYESRYRSAELRTNEAKSRILTIRRSIAAAQRQADSGDTEATSVESAA